MASVISQSANVIDQCTMRYISEAWLIGLVGSMWTCAFPTLCLEPTCPSYRPTTCAQQCVASAMAV